MASGKESVVKVTNSEEKKKALDAAIAKLEKDFGKGAVMKLGESGAHVSVETVPTGCLSLDLALGLGGVPKGRVIEVYGPESSGKTTVALHMISEVQKRGGIAGFIDAEHALDPVYAKNIGVDIDELYISQPDSGDQALEIAETMVRSGAIDIIVIDSVAALVPKQEIEGDILDLASKIDIVKKSGAWYAYEGDKIGQGRENAKSYLESHPEVMEEIERKVRAYYHLDGTEPEDEKKSDLKLTAEKKTDKEKTDAEQAE